MGLNKGEIWSLRRIVYYTAKQIEVAGTAINAYQRQFIIINVRLYSTYTHSIAS